MTFKFSEGDRVALKDNNPILNLKAGTTGLVWAMYASNPPAYEVTIMPPDGREFDMPVDEDDLVLVEAHDPKACAIPPDGR